MTISLFLLLYIIESSVCILLTEALKKIFNKYKEEYSSNLIALMNAVIVGCIGTAFAYILLSIPFNAINITSLFLMIFVIWLGSMVGFDKVKQLIQQIKG